MYIHAIMYVHVHNVHLNTHNQIHQQSHYDYDYDFTYAHDLITLLYLIGHII